MQKADQHYQIVIIGTGFSGLGMAIKLKQSGQDDFVILERAAEIGGTWYENTYPGCACDVPSHLYSFSFALNPDWSRLFSPQPEIWAYMRRCAERYGILPHVRWKCPMQAATWHEEEQLWYIDTPEGRFKARFLILGHGPLSEPSSPAIPGRADFQGTIFHSAQWNHQHNLGGENVAVIGTGASAIQFVPQIQPKVNRLVLFQRTAPWIFPRMDKPIPSWQKKLFRRLPLVQRIIRTFYYWQREFRAIALIYKPERVKIGEALALKYLYHKVKNPELRRKLTPNFSLGCKRILISDDYFDAVTQPNVEVVTERIAEIRPHSVLTTTGQEYPVDTIIMATGFHATDNPTPRLIKGRDGKLLSETWQGDNAQAYLGTTVAGYPNMFMLIGPNTGLGHTSMIFMIESQVNYILKALATLDRRKLRTIEIQPEVQENYNWQIQTRLLTTIWQTGCKSWYINSQGRNTTIWPGFTFNFRRMTRRFDPDSYIMKAENPTRQIVSRRT